MLGHEQIDLLKMNVEGYEWPVFESWPVLSSTTSSNKDDVILPMQVLVEIHTRTQMTALSNVQGEDFKSATDVIRLQQHLLQAGYVVASRDDNWRCPHCTELTLVRTQC